MRLRPRRVKNSSWVSSPPAPGRFAGGRVGEDQVDVRGKVELARAELPERQHHEPHGGAVGVQRGAVCGALPAVEKGEGLVQAGFGQVREVARGLGQVGQARPGRARRCAPSRAAGSAAAEGRGPSASAAPSRAARAARRALPARRVDPRAPPARRSDQQGGVADQAFGHEVAEGQHPLQPVLEVHPPGSGSPASPQACAQARALGARRPPRRISGSAATGLMAHAGRSGGPAGRVYRP